MAQTDSKGDSAGKATAFFERAEQVAETGNWDFAIEMYLQGILRDPENIEVGHQPLREVSLKRKSQGGKGPSMMEQFKRRKAKTPAEGLVNAEYLLAKEPGSVQFMTQFLSAAEKAELKVVIKWICDILLETQRQAAKNNQRVNLKILLLLIQKYHDIEDYTYALVACETAQARAPDNPDLKEAMKMLSAKYAIQKGRFEEGSNFLDRVKDMDKQKELLQKDSLVQDEDYLEQQARKATEEYEAEPTEQGKIYAVVEALCKTQEESYENEAIDILTKALKNTGAYQYKMRIGDIRIKQMTRRYRKLLADSDQTAAAEQAKKQLEFELQEFAERAENYPTDLSIKYELGRRQYLSGQHDEAIASFQQAQRDPRRRLLALNYLGQAFANKGWHSEAAETYERALEGDIPEEKAKGLRYNLANALEQMGDLERAGEQYSQVAQIDFSFKDVRERLEKVRKALKEQDPGEE